MAAKELFGARPRFVEKVNKALIKQLLDDLLEDGVLNDDEKDSILEENPGRADKARDLIDIVRKKGDVASKKMIAHLHLRDPILYAELNLSCGETAQPAAEPQRAQESTTFIRTTEAFWKEKLNDKSIYPVLKNSIQNRMALLITNIKFTDATLNRNGADKDEENMEKLLSSLGYEVMKHTNLTGQAINEAVIEFSKHPKLKHTDSVIVVIMSHGKLGAVLGVNYKRNISADETSDEFPIDNIYKHLGSEKCPALLDKPKIILIQACRGEGRGSVLVCDSATPAVVCDDVTQPGPSPSAAEDDIEADTLRCVHKEKDFISLLSSTPDTVSYRQVDRGCFFIQYIVEVFNSSGRTDDIEELFRKVMQRFEDFSISHRRQMPTKDRCTLTRRFYLFPGI